MARDDFMEFDESQFDPGNITETELRDPREDGYSDDFLHCNNPCLR